MCRNSANASIVSQRLRFGAALLGSWVWWWIIHERRRCSTNVAVVKPFQGLRWLIRTNDLWCAARPQAVLLNSFAVG